MLARNRRFHPGTHALARPVQRAALVADRAQWRCLLRHAATDADRVVAAEYSGLISVFDANTATPLARLGGQEGPVSAVAMLSSGRYVAYGTGGKPAAGTCRPRRCCASVCMSAVRRVRFTAAEDELVSVGDDGKVLVWQVPAWHGRALVDGGPAAKGLAVAANGQVAVGRVDGTLQLWSSTAATSPRAVRLAKQGVETLAYGASARYARRRLQRRHHPAAQGRDPRRHR